MAATWFISGFAVGAISTASIIAIAFVLILSGYDR